MYEIWGKLSPNLVDRQGKKPFTVTGLVDTSMPRWRKDALGRPGTNELVAKGWIKLRELPSSYSKIEALAAWNALKGDPREWIPVQEAGSKPMLRDPEPGELDD